MYQLNFIDYTFLNNPNNTMHTISGTFVFKNTNNIDFKKIVIENINRSIDKAPLAKAIVKESAIKNDYPYLVLCKNFNIEEHVFEHHMSDEKDIDLLIKNILNKDLPLDKPTWNIHIIYHGDKENHVTFFRCAHHAFADGTTYAKNALDIAFDNFILNEKIKYKKINKFNCYVNHFIKLLDSKLQYLRGFVFNAKYISKKDAVIRKDLFPGLWRPKGVYNRDFHNFQYDLSDSEKIMKNFGLTTLVFSFVANSIVYRKILSNKNINNKTILTLYPIPDKTKKNLKNTNQIISSMVNLHINENNVIKLIDLIKNEIEINKNIIKNTPFTFYGRSARLDPRISKNQKGWDLVNKSNWKNKKRIPSKIENSGYAATSTSFFGDGGFSKISIGGNIVQSSHSMTMPLAVPGSIGISSSFRKLGNTLHIGLSYLEELMPNKKELEKMYIEAFEEILKAINGSNR